MRAWKSVTPEQIAAWSIEQIRAEVRHEVEHDMEGGMHRIVGGDALVMRAMAECDELERRLKTELSYWQRHRREAERRQQRFRLEGESDLAAAEDESIAEDIELAELFRAELEKVRQERCSAQRAAVDNDLKPLYRGGW
jgi:hypothetical protein